MTHTVAVGQFEGPLDLLLNLVEQGQLAITQIAVAAVTTRYLTQMRQLPNQTPEALSDFIQLGARLVHIKSLALLPAAPSQAEPQELSQLNAELAEYRQFKQVAQSLSQDNRGTSWRRPVVSKLARHQLPAPNLSLQALSQAFSQALARTQPAVPTDIIAAHISQQEVANHLRRRLAKGSFTLDSLLAQTNDRTHIVVTFLALLELIRDKQLIVSQAGQFAPILLEPTHG